MTGALRRDETLCRHCGARVEANTVGRPRLYCSDRCRKAANRARRSTSAETAWWAGPGVDLHLGDARATALLDTALTEGQTWTTALGAPPTQARAAAAWRQPAHTVAAYRDRYNITDASPLGAPAESDAQKIDAARARAALDRARRLANTEQQKQEPSRRTGPERVRPAL